MDTKKNVSFGGKNVSTNAINSNISDTTPITNMSTGGSNTNGNNDNSRVPQPILDTLPIVNKLSNQIHLQNPNTQPGFDFGVFARSIFPTGETIHNRLSAINSSTATTKSKKNASTDENNVVLVPISTIINELFYSQHENLYTLNIVKDLLEKYNTLYSMERNNSDTSWNALQKDPKTILSNFLSTLALHDVANKLIQQVKPTNVTPISTTTSTNTNSNNANIITNKKSVINSLSTINEDIEDGNNNIIIREESADNNILPINTQDEDEIISKNINENTTVKSEIKNIQLNNTMVVDNKDNLTESKEKKKHHKKAKPSSSKRKSKKKIKITTPL